MYVTLKYNRDFQIKWSYPFVRTQTQTHICIQTGTPIELQIQTQTTHTPTHTDTHTYSHNIDPIFIYITYWFWALEHQISESFFFSVMRQFWPGGAHLAKMKFENGAFLVSLSN